MTELSIPLIVHILLFLGVPLACGYVALRLRMPAIVGYIVSGIVLGAFVSSWFSDVVGVFAQFGLILMLFTIGLEVDIQSIKKFARFVLVGGAMQLIVTTLVMWLLHLIIGLEALPALIIALGFSLSSTAVVSKILSDHGEEHSLIGQLGIGLLVFQDVAAIPMIVIITSLHPEMSMFEAFSSIFRALILSTIIIVSMVVIGFRFVPFVMSKISTLSRELLNLFVVLLIFTTVLFFSFLGLSASLAAFIAGAVIGHTMEHYNIFSQIRPLRDLFVIMFFVFLGISLNISSSLSLLPLIIIFACVLVIIKTSIVIAIVIALRFHSKSAFGLGILLSQVGEFAFILFSLSYGAGLISQHEYIFGIGVTLATLIISPIGIEYRNQCYNAIRAFFRKHTSFIEQYISYAIDREPAHIEGIHMKDHVIICGYGRVGRYIGRALLMAHIPFVAIDYNRSVVEQARKEGVEIVYGDPTDIDILDFAQVETARAIVAAIENPFAREVIVLNAKQLNTSIITIARTSQEKEQKRLKSLGVEMIIQPEFEAALSIIKKLFVTQSFKKEEIIGKIKRLRIEHGMV